MKTCNRVIYTGHVQGVGFRYTSQRLAKGYAISGYVRNLADGSVELVVEGQQTEVDRFLAALDEQMAGYVEARTVYDHEPCGFRGFVLRS